MRVLLSARSGDMFYGINHLFRLPPGTTICHTHYHDSLKEALEWICPKRFNWEKIDIDKYFNFCKATYANVTREFIGNKADFDIIVNAYDHHPSRTPEAFAAAIPCTGPCLVFPVTRELRKDLSILDKLQFPKNTIICVPEEKVNEYHGTCMSLAECVEIQPCGVIGACSFPVLFMCWLGFHCLKIHMLDFTYERARLNSLGGDDMLHTDIIGIQGWINSLK